MPCMAATAASAARAARGPAEVLAVQRTRTVRTCPPVPPIGDGHADDRIAAQALTAWPRLRGGAGAQGERVYDRASGVLRPALCAGWGQGLLGRRSPQRPDDRAGQRVYAPDERGLTAIVRVAGPRTRSADCLTLAQGQVGLDQAEGRAWRGWHRQMTPARRAVETARANRGPRRRPRAAPCRGTPPAAEPLRRRASAQHRDRVVALAPPAPGDRPPRPDPPPRCP